MPGTGPGTWAMLMHETEIPNSWGTGAQDTTLNKVVREGPVEKVPRCGFLFLPPHMARPMNDELFVYE